MAFDEHRVVHCQCNSCRVSCQSKHTDYWVILYFFGQFRSLLCPGAPLCELEIPYLGSFIENRAVGYHKLLLGPALLTHDVVTERHPGSCPGLLCYVVTLVFVSQQLPLQADTG